MLAVGDLVELPQEIHRLQVLVAAVLVGQPLAGVAGIIQIEHGSDGVDAQAVQVELLQPEEGAGEQEVLHLVPSEVEDQGPPVLVFAQPRVLVLVKGRAVIAGQGEGVAGEVGRHPVEEDADPLLVQVVDEPAEVVR